MNVNIENDKNVYVLGAGFSAVRGLPGIRDFMLRLRDAHPWLASRQRGTEAAAVERVIQYRLQSAAAAYRVPIDLENIEELFSLADAGKDVLSRDIRVAIAATLDFAEHTQPNPFTEFECTNVQMLPTGWEVGKQVPVRCRAPTYEFFLQVLLGRWLNPQPKSAVLSFNYDCLVEEALTGLGVPFDYGFRVGKPAFDNPSKSSSEHMGAGGGVPVLKLHGSTNWRRQNGRGGPVLVVGSYAEVRDAGGAPELVPPTWRKLFARELVEIWKRALEELRTATRIVILGFSMPETDLHFKYLLAAGLRENVSLREIVFVDRNPGAILNRAKVMFGEDMDRRPGVRVVGRSISHFVGEPGMDGGLSSIGRSVPREIQNISHSWY